jgi:branched-chain amino acid transport system ATP-binding protein
MIDFLELGKYRKSQSSTLPYGTQKIVGLGRALVMEPQILLLDEPSAGMNRQEKEDIARFILRIKQEIGVTIIWVEHDMQLAGDLADRGVVLNFGTKIAEGSPDAVLSDPNVIKTYLGTRTEEVSTKTETPKDKQVPMSDSHPFTRAGLMSLDQLQ